MPLRVPRAAGRAAAVPRHARRALEHQPVPLPQSRRRLRPRAGRLRGARRRDAPDFEAFLRAPRLPLRARKSATPRYRAVPGRVVIPVPSPQSQSPVPSPGLRVPSPGYRVPAPGPQAHAMLAGTHVRRTNRMVPCRPARVRNGPLVTDGQHRSRTPAQSLAQDARVPAGRARCASSSLLGARPHGVCRHATSTGSPAPTVNNFLNSHTLIQTATDASFFAIMAVGATIVIISGGIDLSVGSVYALAGVRDGAGPARAGPGGRRRRRAARRSSVASASGSLRRAQRR